MMHFCNKNLSTFTVSKVIHGSVVLLRGGAAHVFWQFDLLIWVQTLSDPEFSETFQILFFSSIKTIHYEWYSVYTANKYNILTRTD